MPTSNTTDPAKAFHEKVTACVLYVCASLSTRRSALLEGGERAEALSNRKSRNIGDVGKE